MSWTPLHLHLHTSLLDAFSKPEEVVDRCVELGYKSCAVTDHGNLFGSVEFFKACQKKGIKPILGCEIYVCDQDATIQTPENRNKHAVILAKNKDGWQSLISLVSKSNENEVYYYKPRLDLDRIKEFSGNLIALSGHPGTQLSEALFEDGFYSCKTVEEAEKKLKPDWFECGKKVCEKYQEVFGKDNFFIEIQLCDVNRMQPRIVLAKALRELAQKLNIMTVATSDTHYVNKSDAVYQRICLCSNLQLTLPEVNRKIIEDDFGLRGFFESDEYHLPTVEELQNWGNTLEEIDNANKIADMCEAYNILSSVPILPNFEWTEGKSEIEYLRDLCRIGWQKRITNSWDKEVYGNRVKEELAIIEEANLAGYFLIVQDIINWAKRQGILCGHARGSSGGSLVAYLLNIIEIDPIPNGLLFSRFYNAGRKGTLPDIDMDFPPSYRPMLIEYAKNRYGHDRVCQIMTLGKMQGRGAVKEVFRIYEVCDHITANKITSGIPNEADIMDKLEEDGEKSILRWILKNEPKILSEYCTMKDDGTLEGQYAEYFKLAIGIEGTYKSQSKHAAGIVISGEVLSKVCPMIRDKSSSDPIAGLDMNSLADLGHTKFDFLGVAGLEKLMIVNRLLQFGFNKEEVVVI